MPSALRERGFTLIELMAGLALLALLIILGLPSFTAFVRNSEVRSTAESLLNGLRAAASEATKRNTNVAFKLAGGGDPSWTINVVTDTETMELEQPPIQTFARKEAGSNTTVTIGGDKPYVVFNGLGRVRIDPANRNDHIRQIDVSAASGEARSLRIIVDDSTAAQSALRMCEPDLSSPDPRAC